MTLKAFKRYFTDNYDINSLQDRLEEFFKTLIIHPVLTYDFQKNLDMNGFNITNAGSVATTGTGTTGTTGTSNLRTNIHAVCSANALTSAPALTSNVYNCSAVSSPAPGKYEFTIASAPTQIFVMTSSTGNQNPGPYILAGYKQTNTSIRIESVNTSGALTDIPDGITLVALVIGG